MPRYSKRKRKGFKHPYEILHMLSTGRPEDLKPMRDKAKEYLSGKSKPPIPLSKDALVHVAHNKPAYLTKQTAHDFNSKLGGGIGSAVSVIGSQIAHFTGVDAFMNFIGSVPKPGQSSESEIAAYLVDLTYNDVSSRPDKAMMYSRLPQFDSEHMSVWRNGETDELMVTVRGTKMKASDAGFFEFAIHPQNSSTSLQHFKIGDKVVVKHQITKIDVKS